MKTSSIGIPFASHLTDLKIVDKLSGGGRMTQAEVCMDEMNPTIDELIEYYEDSLFTDGNLVIPTEVFPNRMRNALPYMIERVSDRKPCDEDCLNLMIKILDLYVSSPIDPKEFKCLTDEFNDRFESKYSVSECVFAFVDRLIKVIAQNMQA